jgi:hypothetical protein
MEALALEEIFSFQSASFITGMPCAFLCMPFSMPPPGSSILILIIIKVINALRGHKLATLA